MSDDPKLAAQRRETVGSSATKKLRNAGRIPASLYGHKEGAVSLSVDADELNPVIASGHKVVDVDLDGKVDKAMIQDVQWDTFSRFVQHIDLLRVDANERVSTEVELDVRGIAPGVLAGGILEQPHHYLPIECPVIRLPESIVVKVNDLKLNESILVSDLELPKDCVSTLPDDEVIVQVIEPRAPEPEEEPETEAPEGEPEMVAASEEGEEEGGEEESGNKE